MGASTFSLVDMVFPPVAVYEASAKPLSSRDGVERVLGIVALALPTLSNENDAFLMLRAQGSLTQIGTVALPGPHRGSMKAGRRIFGPPAK
jgi:hypothetical protein